MKILLLAAMFIIHTAAPPSTMVYVCRGAKGKKYHLTANCRGLRNCQHKIDKMKLSDAQKHGLTLCGWEK